MRLLLLAQFFPPDIGGEELHVFNLANTLADRGHDVAVGTQQLGGTPDKEVLSSGVRVHRFETTAMRLPGLYSTGRPHHPPIPDPLGVRELRRIVRLERPDVVHAHNWIVNSAVALRRRRSAGDSPFGLVLTLHDYSQVCATKRFMREGAPCAGPAPLRCLSCATAHYGAIAGPVTAVATAAMRPWKTAAVDHVVSVSRAVALGNRIPSGPGSSVIPNFVPDATILPSPADQADRPAPGSACAIPDGDFLLYVGDLSVDKGVTVLLRAYESLGPGRPPLIMIGRRTADTPAKLPRGAKLHVDWPHEHVLAAFRRCTVAVLPSIWPDPCPTTVLEAMASGRPVITTSIGGMTDMIDDGTSGRLVPPASVSELAVAIDRLLADGQERARLGAGALQKVRGFTATAVAGQLEAVYGKVASGQQRPQRPRSAN
jgi:glycosyltransferase involved in cell wall biosynthesis